MYTKYEHIESPGCSPPEQPGAHLVKKLLTYEYYSMIFSVAFLNLSLLSFMYIYGIALYLHLIFHGHE